MLKFIAGIAAVSKWLFLCMLITNLTTIDLFGQQVGGTANPVVSDRVDLNKTGSGIITSSILADDFTFSTSVFTFNDITLFSYFNDSDLYIIDTSGDTLYAETLNANEFHTQFAGRGTFTITGSKSFTVLVGDAVSDIVQGYFANDQSGRSTSTLINTYMMGQFDDEKFIIFGYEDNTEFNVKNLQTDEILFAGILHKGENYTFPNTPFDTFLQVSANKPVSALSYGDQGYFVPAKNGTFSGTTLYGYSGFIGGWTNSITVTSYHDDNQVLILDSDTGDILASNTLGKGQVITLPVTTPTYWEIQAQKTITAANIPYADWAGNYFYMARVPDDKGTGSGSLFYVPTIASDIDVFSFEDDNNIIITYLGQNTDFPYNSSSREIVFDNTLQAGERFTFFSKFGNHVYKVESSKKVSVVQSNGNAGADFVPLKFTEELPDLAISESGLSFDPPDSVFREGDQVTISLWVSNFGPVDADNINVELYNGNVSSHGTPPVIDVQNIPFIAGQDSAQVNMKFIVPKDPEFRTLSVRVDPDDLIRESNNSNNTLIRALVPNEDLQPPFSVFIEAPDRLEMNEEKVILDPFTVKIRIFNQEAIPFNNISVNLLLFDGLTLVEGSQDTLIASLAGESEFDLNWTLQADSLFHGINKYIIQIEADNADLKEVKRSVLVPDMVPPEDPINLTAEITGNTNGSVVLNWTPNTEEDLAGYQIYYGTESRTYDGKVAAQGVSPITTSTFNEFEITGLKDGIEYFFALKAFDNSNNLSEFSEEAVAALFTSIDERSEEIPGDYKIEQNYPNPFNPATNIRFSLPKATNVEIRLYDMLGREVLTLLNEFRPAGTHIINVELSSLSSGIYIYQMKADSFIENRKLTLIK